MINRSAAQSIFDGVRPILADGDLLLGNQEGPITDRGNPVPGKAEVGSRHVRAALGNAEALASVGFSAMTLANNHMMDYGPEGLSQTIELLSKYGIRYAGAGKDFDAAHEPAMLERNGVTIAMLGYTTVYTAIGYQAGNETPGVATVRVDTSYQPQENHFYQPASPPVIVATPDAAAMEVMIGDIKRAKTRADLVVVQFHWGVSHEYGRISGYMKEMGRAAVDAGADLILGNHAHQLYGFEIYGERLICYSLNHFAFDKFQDWRGWLDAVILKVIVENGRFTRFSVLPIRIDRESRNPSLAQGEHREAIHRELEMMSKEFGTTFTLDDGELVLSGPVAGTPPPLRAPAVLRDRLSSRSYPILYKG